MPIVNMTDLLKHAHGHGYAVGAFAVTGLEALEAIVAAAERARAPAILALGASPLEPFDAELAMPAAERAAQRASIPVAIHLERCASLDAAVQAIRLGANSIMPDAGGRSTSEYLALARALVRTAHACGVAVAGELACGSDPGSGSGPDGTAGGEMRCPSAAEARDFVKLTGVDCLSVSVGTALAGRAKGRPRLDWTRLREINAALGVPVAIRGGGGLTDEQVRKLIALGVARIDCRAALAEAAGESMRAAVKAGAREQAALVAGVRDAVAAEVERCLRVFGAAGRAAEVLASCRPWLNVEQIVVYNAPPGEPDRLRAMMAEGQRALAAIPGVREVRAGSVIDQGARYRHCWLIRFSAPEALDSYRRHPAHLAFVERLFRPLVTEQIAANYRVADALVGAAALPDAASLAHTGSLAA